MSAEASNKKISMIRGIRKHAIQKFVQFLKDEAPGHANPDMTVTMEAMSFDDLDTLVNKFLGDNDATDQARH